MTTHYDVTCAASNSLLRPLVRRLPGLARLVDEIQARHDAIVSLEAGGVVQLSLGCVADWLHAATPSLAQIAKWHDEINATFGVE